MKEMQTIEFDCGCRIATRSETTSFVGVDICSTHDLRKSNGFQEFMSMDRVKISFLESGQDLELECGCIITVGVSPDGWVISCESMLCDDHEMFLHGLKIRS